MYGNIICIGKHLVLILIDLKVYIYKCIEAI